MFYSPSKKYPKSVKRLVARFRALEPTARKLTIISFLLSNWFFFTLRDNELYSDLDSGGFFLLDILTYLLTVPILTPICFGLLAITLELLEAFLKWLNKP